MKKRLFSLFLVIILAFVSVENVRADAGTLIVAGGSVAGVTAGAIAGPAVVAVFCAMMAFGMNVELTEASAEAGMTKTEFLKNKIQEYCNEAQISATTFNNYVLDQANVFQNGAISLTDKAGNLIQKFCNWLWSSGQVNEGEIPTVNINGLDLPVISPGVSGVLSTVTNEGGSADALYFYNTGNCKLALVACRYVYDNIPHIGFYAFTNEGDITQIDMESECILPFQNSMHDFGKQFSYMGTINNIHYGSVFATYASYVSNFNIPLYQGTIEEYINSISSLDLDNGIPINQDYISGDSSIYNDTSNILNPTDNQTIVINPNITIPVPQDKDVTIDVNEYLDIVQEMIDGLAEDIITAIDDATDVPITIEFDPTQDWDPTIEKEDDTDLPPDDEKTPVIKDDILPHDFDPDPMKFDLKGIFPFCIPWDVKDMLSKLSADPVAPSYTVNWMVPIVNERLIFTVDLSPFNGVAKVCRTMELFAFCIGLAIVTRQLFLRG